MFEHTTRYEDALRFSRFDNDHPLSTWVQRPFLLDGRQWLTAEHYYQANKFVDPLYRDRVADAATAAEAYRLGHAWFKRKRSDLKRVRVALMTRALYSLVQQHTDVRDYLLATGERLLAETSQFDPFWGVGRDQRGYNHLGNIWMNIRSRLRPNADHSNQGNRPNE